MSKNNFSAFSDRMVYLKEQYAKGKRSNLAKITGIQESLLRKYEEGSTPSADNIKKIVKSLPVNTHWLITGEGEIESNTDNSQTTVKEEQAQYKPMSNFMEVPLVNQYAHAGYLSGFADEEYLEELPHVPFPVQGAAKGNYVAFEIFGDSMYDGTPDSYDEGEIALCREIPQYLWQSKLHTHKWKDYVIVHKEEGILVKRIVDHNVEKGIISCKSLNPIFNGFDINLKDVMKLFNVIKTIKNR